MATLEEIPLKFGHLLQLQMPRLDQHRLYGKLIGYLVDQVVLVTMPGAGEQAVPVMEGDAMVCRGFAGRSAFGFQTRVLKVLQAPFPHLYLAYPKTVESVLVRKAARLAMQLEAALLKSAEQGELREPATLIDLSASGGCASAKAEFAAVKDSLTLLLPARADQPELRFGVVVRSARLSDPGGSQGPTCQYGMEFVDLSAEQRQAIEKLLQEQLARTL
jgi:Flagellar protein YcgR/PilZ domain